MLLQFIQWPWTARERLLRGSPRNSESTTTQVPREIDAHRQTLIIGTAWIVIGERKRRSRTKSWPGSSVRRNASTSARGKARASTTGTRRPLATFQKGVLGRWSRQKPCHRAMVAPSTPNNLESSRTRRGDGPCRIALIKMTTTPRYTFLPRKRTDGGVARLLQPSRSQQKLNRWKYSSGRSSGPPRGARG